MEPRNRFQGMNSASVCSLTGRYDNPIPSWFGSQPPQIVLKFQLRLHSIPELVPWNRFFLSLFVSLCTRLSAEGGREDAECWGSFKMERAKKVGPADSLSWQYLFNFNFKQESSVSLLIWSKNAIKKLEMYRIFKNSLDQQILPSLKKS